MHPACERMRVSTEIFPEEPWGMASQGGQGYASGVWSLGLTGEPKSQKGQS